MLLALDTCRHGIAMRDVPSHANELRMLLSLDGIIPDDTVWLSLAAGLQVVTIDLQSHDPSIWMCGSAFEYYAAHSSVSSALMTEITRFLYCWGALEFFIGELPGRKSKVAEVCKRLAVAEKLYGRPSHFDCVASHLKECLVKRSSSFNVYVREITEDYGQNAQSVFSFVSRIRNGLAHGVLKSPSAAECGGRPAHDLAFVCCCQRVVLFVLQMLIVAQHPHSKALYRGSDGYSDAAIKDVWDQIHLDFEEDF